MAPEQRSTYNDRVEVWVDGGKYCDTVAHLTGFVDVTVIPGNAGRPPERFDGTTSWAGSLELDQRQRDELFGRQLELRFPNGNTGDAFIRNQNQIRGSGETPF